MKTKLIEYTLRHFQLVNFLTANSNGITAVVLGLMIMLGKV